MNDTTTNRFDFYPNGDFTTMMPGEGYFINVFERDTLMYYGFGTGTNAPVTKHASVEKTAPRGTISGASAGISELPQAVFLYGLHVQMNGTVVPAGTTVSALTMDGQVCGTGKFVADGVFSLAVAGDIASTDAVEGVRKGEKFRVVIGGKEVAQKITWNELGDTPVLDGNLLGVESAGDLPKQFVLEQNYPNPFNPSTTIRFGLPLRSNVRVTIYSITGQRVADLYNGVHDAGFVSLQWNSSGVASGVYYYRIDASAVDKPDTHFSDVRKMMLLR